jgi:hypothetical protein
MQLVLLVCAMWCALVNDPLGAPVHFLTAEFIDRDSFNKSALSSQRDDHLIPTSKELTLTS